MLSHSALTDVRASKSNSDLNNEKQENLTENEKSTLRNLSITPDSQIVEEEDECEEAEGIDQVDNNFVLPASQSEDSRLSAVSETDSQPEQMVPAQPHRRQSIFQKISQALSHSGGGSGSNSRHSSTRTSIATIKPSDLAQVMGSQEKLKVDKGPRRFSVAQPNFPLSSENIPELALHQDDPETYQRQVAQAVDFIDLRGKENWKLKIEASNR